MHDLAFTSEELAGEGGFLKPLGKDRISSRMAVVSITNDCSVQETKEMSEDLLASRITYLDRNVEGTLASEEYWWPLCQ